MKANQLKVEHVYIYAGGQKELCVMYNGMIEGDRYMFTPVHPTKKHFCGIPNSLCEQEVVNLIKPMA